MGGALHGSVPGFEGEVHVGEVGLEVCIHNVPAVHLSAEMRIDTETMVP